MKKFFALTLSALLAMSVLTACGGDDSSSTVTAEYDVDDILRTVEKATYMENPKEMDEAYVDWLLDTDNETYEDFAGRYVQVNEGSVEMVLAVHAKDGHAAEIRSRMTSHADAMSAERVSYNKEAADRAENARVVTKGNYVVLAVVSETAVTNAGSLDAAYEAVDTAIDEAFK